MRAGVIDEGRAARPLPRALTVADVAALHASLDPAETALTIARVLLEVTGARSCGLWSVDAGPPAALAGVTAAGAPAPGFAGRTAPPSKAVEGVAASLRAAVAHSPDAPALVPEGDGPALLVPLPWRGTALAVAALDDDGAPFPPEAMAMVEEAGCNAAAALANALDCARTEAELARAVERAERLEVVHASLGAEAEEAERGAALAHERDRIAAGLHDTAGQLFVAIRLLARREAEQLPPASEAAARLHRLADLADQGKWEIDHAIDALALFPAARHGLAPALRSLGSSFHADGELDVIVDVRGRPARLPAQVERALYRVVHESLASARHSRCSVVRVALTFDAAGVHLQVADDGTSLTGTIPDRGRPGTSELRRKIADAGGTLHIASAQPRGVVIDALIPKERT